MLFFLRGENEMVDLPSFKSNELICSDPIMKSCLDMERVEKMEPLHKHE